ncbi:MmgE/PrpD family protein [Pseudoruegeria sp. HB172150]|uniref:MmgE/PrpD family protein n=1 Tax=Pseudoruegeria sp. HB172150 TaxID=2721164 RepID=UPI001554845F|nr:MmgE/PrpD family protein [Pseudoruegeria sp. HB172150]
MLTRRLAETAAAIRYADLPAKAQHAARICLADGLSTMAAATALEPRATLFSDHARTPGPCTLLAGGTSTPAGAALGNGALAHAIDFEDTFEPAGLHPNAALIPTVLALAEAENRTLADILAAMAIGCDIACRFGLSLASDPATRGWYHPPMIGAIAAGFGAAHLLHLTPEQTVDAVSLTLCQFMLTDELKRSPASDLRAVRDGFAARAAVEGALLARMGVKGVLEPLEGRSGLAAILAGDPPDKSAFEDFGQTFAGETVSLKQWPCCRGTHEAIAFALDLRIQGVGPDNITAAAFTLHPPNDMLFNPLEERQKPTTPIGARFSIPFCFACALIHGAPGLSSFAPAALSDANVLALAVRITMAGCAPGNTQSARLTMSDGAKTDHILPDPPAVIASATDFRAMSGKWLDCLLHALPKIVATGLLDKLATAPGETPAAVLLDPFRRISVPNAEN